MIESSFAITGTFIAYLILMVAIGVYAYKKTSSSSDYFLGGRSLGPWPAALSAGASDMSGWLLLGLPGYAYAAGIESFWLVGGYLGKLVSQCQTSSHLQYSNGCTYIA